MSQSLNDEDDRRAGSNARSSSASVPAGMMMGSSSTTSIAGSHDAFRRVDDLVAKPTYGSDGAAAWQSFRQSALDNSNSTDDMRRAVIKSSGSSSLGSAPLAPLKKLDRVALQFNSWDDEVKNERKLRQQDGQSSMNAGYQLFHEKMKKKTKEEVEVADSSSGAARRSGDADHGAVQGTKKRPGDDDDVRNATNESGTKRKKVKSKSKASSVAPVMVDTPDHPLQQLAMALQSRQQQQQQQQHHPASSASSAAALPPGWESSWDASSQKTYYFNRSTGQRQWTVPGLELAEGSAVTLTSAPANAAASETTAKSDDDNNDKPLAPGWVAATDPTTQKTYYYHEETRETRWIKPTAAPIEGGVK